MNKFSLFLFSAACILCIVPSVIFAASPDGSGPWADAVISANQGVMKNGQPVPDIRSNPQAAVGPAENDNNDGYFFSLGFGGSIVLKFENGVQDGVLVVESTWPDYPLEKAKVEVSQDGNTWTVAGNVVQDGEVSMPENVSCINYVKITDISNKDEFPDDIADGYDVDGVKALNADACNNGGNTGGQTTPTPTPSGTVPSPTPTPGESTNNNDGGSSSGSSNNSQPQQCNAGKPNTPSITSIVRTSATTVELSWTEASPVTTYAIFYGTSAGNYQYGVPSTGNVTKFVVGGLDPNASYYFQVRAVNDCMPGDPSSEQSAGQVLGAAIGGGEVLGATTDVLGATGSASSVIATAVALLGGIISYVFYKKTVN